MRSSTILIAAAPLSSAITNLDTEASYLSILPSATPVVSTSEWSLILWVGNDVKKPDKSGGVYVNVPVALAYDKEPLPLAVLVVTERSDNAT